MRIIIRTQSLAGTCQEQDAGLLAVGEDFSLSLETGLARLGLALLGSPRVREIHMMLIHCFTQQASA